MAHLELRTLSHAGFRYPAPQRRTLRRSLRQALSRCVAAIDWVIPLAALAGLAMAALAAVQAGGEVSAAPTDAVTAGGVTAARVIALPGMPQILRQLDHSEGAMERCDGLTGQCRTLPVEDRIFRMSDGSDWIARTAFDDHGRQAFTLWYDQQGRMVGAPVGL